MGNKESCSNFDQVYLLNSKCTNGLESSDYECYKNHGPMTEPGRIITGIWHIFIGIIGIFGNATTLIALPYASMKKRHGIDNGYKTTTIFLTHLAFVDLSRCLWMTIPRGIMFLRNNSPFGIYGCQIVMYGGFVTFVADMLALSLVALSRCLDTVVMVTWTTFCSRKRNTFVLFILTWTISLMVVPTMLTLHSYGIEIGWNCETGDCGFIRDCKSLNVARKIEGLPGQSKECAIPMEMWRKMYIVNIIPLGSISIIICCYLIIFYKTHSSKRNFSAEEETFNALRRRQWKMTNTILVLTVSNVFFWITGLLIMIASFGERLSDSWKPMKTYEYAAYMVFINIFEIQYSLNFFIYIFRSDPYRSAFIDLFTLIPNSIIEMIPLKQTTSNSIEKRENS